MTETTNAQQQIPENEIYMQENQNKEQEGERPVSDAALALAYYRETLRSTTATATEKANAANGLARLAKEEEDRNSGKLHHMDRAELVAEINRIKARLDAG
jgi:hypothetical protein